MDETEITNNEYRQFVNWVKDSIIKTRLAITADEQEKKPGTGGIGEFAFADADTTKMSVYDKYMYKNYYSVGTDDDMYSGRKLNQKLKSMPAVSLLLSDGSAYGEKGNIETVNGLINTETGTVNIRARFPNPKGVIRSGSSTTVRIPTDVKDAIIVPQSATFELQDKMFVVVLGKDGKTRNANIAVLENTAGNYYVVTSGLNPGDEIVLEGVASLKEGTEIKAKKQSPETVYADLK